MSKYNFKDWSLLNKGVLNFHNIKENPLVLFLFQMFSSIVLTLCAQLLYDKISYAGMFTICGGFGLIGKYLLLIM